MRSAGVNVTPPPPPPPPQKAAASVDMVGTSKIVNTLICLALQQFICFFRSIRLLAQVDIIDINLTGFAGIDMDRSGPPLG
jgi:hypothetical protein